VKERYEPAAGASPISDRAAVGSAQPALLLALVSILVAVMPVIAEQASPPIYECDFQKLDLGAAPPEFKALRGEFAVQQEKQNRFLEVAPTPLNSFGVLVGPEPGAGTSIKARLRGESIGKRFPEMGIGVGGTKGYQLWLMPAVGQLQVRRDNLILARAPFSFRSGQWIHMHLQVRSEGDGRWRVAGKCWTDGSPAPADWMIQLPLNEAPPTGRPSLWGTPYSEMPIQFDDLRID
jgi:hypothetical protein